MVFILLNNLTMYKAQLLKKIYHLQSKIKHYIQFCTHKEKLENMECVLANVEGLLEATLNLPNIKHFWPLFEKSYREYKKDYLSISFCHEDKKFFFKRS